VVTEKKEVIDAGKASAKEAAPFQQQAKFQVDLLSINSPVKWRREKPNATLNDLKENDL